MEQVQPMVTQCRLHGIVNMHCVPQPQRVKPPMPTADTFNRVLQRQFGCVASHAHGMLPHHWLWRQSRLLTVSPCSAQGHQEKVPAQDKASSEGSPRESLQGWSCTPTLSIPPRPCTKCDCQTCHWHCSCSPMQRQAGTDGSEPLCANCLCYAWDSGAAACWLWDFSQHS